MGAANNFDTLTNLKSPERWKITENAKYFYLDGFLLKKNFDIVQTISKYAFENNKVYCYIVYD